MPRNKVYAEHVQLSEVELVVRESGSLPVPVELAGNGPFHSSADVFGTFQHLRRMTRETFIVLLLDGKNRIVAHNVVSIGSLTRL